MEEKPEKKSNGKANRVKGHTYERNLAKFFRDIGYSFCKTSRQASRLLDDSKVDLAFIPFNVQAKSVKAPINYKKVFTEMEEALKKNFPPEDLQNIHPKMIFHKRGRLKYDSLVIMEEKEFMDLLKKIKDGRN